MQFKVTYLTGGNTDESVMPRSEFLDSLRDRPQLESGADDRGVCETVRDVLENIRENVHTCTEVRNSTRETITLCVQDKERSDREGRWRGRTVEVPSGEVYRVNGREADIEGMVHSDGSVTKFKGIACKGWTEEHSSEWLAANWPDCGNASGRTQSPRFFVDGFQELSVFSFARVNSATTGWHEGKPLAKNRSYRIIPRSSDRWTINRGHSFNNFTGDGQMDGTEIGVPKNPLRLGGVVVLVWHHQADGSAVPQIIDFSPGHNAAEFSVGEWGGSIHFMISDRAGTYADNFGDCIVAMAML